MTEKLWWEDAYKSGKPENIPWETNKPSKYLVDLVERNMIPGKTVLDACSGLGTQALYLARNGFEVHGVEISETAVSKAKLFADKEGLKIHFLKGTVQKLPFENSFFDFIYDRGCLHHQKDDELKKYLSEASRVLKAGGRMFIIAFTSRFSKKELTDLFKADFVVLEYSKFSEKAADRLVREFHGILIEKKRKT